MAETVSHRQHLDRLAVVVDQNAELLKEFEGLNSDQLNWRPLKSEWSIGQNILHLVKANGEYLRAVEERLYSAPQAADPPTDYYPGVLGKLFIKLNGPEPPFRVPTLKAMDPSGTEVSEEVFDEYKSVVERERQVIAAADKADLNRTKIPDPYATWLRFTLGETLDLLMWHDNRHLLQGYRVHKLPEFPSA